MERLFRRSHATGLRWVALSLVGLGIVAAACSSDNPTPGNGASAGQGGEAPAGGKTTTGGTAIKMTGGAAGETAGEGGVGGVPPMPSVGEQCTACSATACTDTMKTCSDSPECAAWLGCLSACASGDCVTACDATHAGAARVYTGVYDCMCTSCKDACLEAKACDKKTCVDDNALPTTDMAPATLAETGLYATVDGAGGAGAGGAGGAPSVELAMPIKIASYARTFEPKYPLWADGATKQRYVYIPKCSTIDTSDMDHWKFPIGTRFWKTFSVGQTVVETRMLHRFGTGPLDWMYAAYQWDVSAGGNPAAAKLVADTGVLNANGTTHDIPGVGQCRACHNGLPEKVLGFSAFQLSHDTNAVDLTIKKISELGWLTKPAPAGFQVPGTPAQQAALGYMHGNCGGCHNDSTPTPASKPQILRLSVAQTTYAITDAVKTTLGVVVVSGNAAITGKSRIAAMDPDNSAILIRMKSRTPGLQMPPLGTKVVDTNGGVIDVTAWVNSIP
jgi:hypothetical protein